MTFTVTRTILDTAGRPVPGASITVAPTTLPLQTVAGEVTRAVTALTDPVTGTATVAVMHVPGVTFTCTGTGVAPMTFESPGEGGIVDVGAL